MKRSTSFVQGRTIVQEYAPAAQERPNIDYNRFIYINTEEAHKEKHTIFHSPYKGGRKNPNYSNPSFMSSEIFYPRDYSFNEHSKSKPKVGLIPTKNDIVYEEQYKSRMLRKSYSGTCLNRQLQQQKKKQIELTESNIEKSIQRVGSQAKLSNKILRKIQDSKQLKHQLELIRKSPPRALYQRSTQDQNPIYLQGRHSIVNRMLKKQSSKRQLIDEMSKALKRKQEQKWQKENEKKNDKALIDREAQRFYAGVKSSSEYERQRARLLSELLLEQILHKS